MHMEFHVDRNVVDRRDTPDADEPAKVGWIIDQEHAGVIFDPPRRLRSGGANDHAKSAVRCPAIRDLSSRHWVVSAPFDLDIGFHRTSGGGATLVNRKGDRSAVRTSVLDDMLHLVDENEWRFPDRPLLQLSLPYLFVADESVHLSQVPPFAHYSATALPGIMLAGRFPIDVWPRPLMWAFEWHDTDTDIHISRGDPLFYCGFECSAPDRGVELVEAQMTPELRRYLDHISGAVNFVSKTFDLFEAAERVRPPSLIEPVRRTSEK